MSTNTFLRRNITGGENDNMFYEVAYEVIIARWLYAALNYNELPFISNHRARQE